MCGRFVQTPFTGRVPWPGLSDDFEAIPANFNLAPTQRAAILLSDAGALVIRRLHWGLLPHWMRDKRQTFSTINARLETVDTKPAFRSAFKAPRRCLVPMLGYYEWREEGGAKQPYLIRPTDGAQLYAAGLWEPRNHALQDEGEHGSCTIITHDAVDAAGEVHDRMPVFLPAELAREWMTAAPDAAMAMLMAAEPPALLAYRVSRAVNNARNRGGPECLEPID